MNGTNSERKEEEKKTADKQEWTFSGLGLVGLRGNNKPLLELRIDHPAGEALTANTDTLQYAVTLELVQHEKCIKDS